MNIILLSGGSGTRLWPLSNEVHSKQFVRLFKNESGDYESMIQRVYHQIRKADPYANITIAASKNQVSAIQNQLGEHVSVCIEPCRRDTFPAIVLAAAYLKYELNVDENESVVVCPVDPYVDDTYFKSVSELEEMAKQNISNLVLMGIEPSCPSERYGYIIPKIKDRISEVKEFKEKPNRENAEKYIEEGALWNAGVFAFQLSYLLDKAHRMVDFTDYRNLYAKYDTLEKISFDYAVVEKEKSIQVLRYSGEWKDVGTWNTIAEVMSDKVRGNVALDTTCENTNVMNELNIPVLCMGCKNMVVAVSGDGILVADKSQSEYMKPYVEKISTDARYMEKTWGTFTVVDAHSDSMTIRISLLKGKHLNYHSHEHREEVWTIIKGTGKTIVDGMEQEVHAGDVVMIAIGCKHTIIAETDMDIIEIQMGQTISRYDKTVHPFDMKPMEW